MNTICLRNLFLFLFVSLLFHSTSYAATISGTVYLPSGTAPAGGMEVEVSATNQNGDFEIAYVTILGGDSLMSYSINVPDDVGSSWTVDYFVPGESSFVRYGYYGGTVTQWDWALALPLAGGTTPHTGIDLTLLAGQTISGTVWLPGVDTAPVGGIELDVWAFSQNTGNAYYTFVTIPFTPPNNSSVDYTIVVPDDPGTSWTVEYSLYDPGIYLDVGYLGDTGTQYNLNLATLLAGGMAHTGKDLTLLYSRTISGTVTLPGSAIAPIGGSGIDLDVWAISDSIDNYYKNTTVTILPGASSAIYTIAVPVDFALNWTVSYNLWNNSSYLFAGYYRNVTPSSTEWDPSMAIPLPGGTDHSGIDLAILASGNTISGTVYLPTGTAPVGGMEVGIDVWNQNDVYLYGYVVIPDGGTSMAYTIGIPPHDGVSEWTVAYYSNDTDTYLNSGYFNAGPPVITTEWDVSLATPLGGGADHPGTDLTLLTGNTISGTVYLPDQDTASIGNIIFDVLVTSQFSDQFVYYGIIPAGASSADYSVIVPDEGVSLQWYVDYYLYSSSFYLLDGSFSNSGTQWDLLLGDQLTGGSDYPTTPLTLLPKGDMNFNRSLDLTDVMLGVQILTGMSPAGIVVETGDTNNNLKIGMEDVLFDLGRLAQ